MSRTVFVLNFLKLFAIPALLLIAFAGRVHADEWTEFDDADIKTLLESVGE